MHNACVDTRDLKFSNIDFLAVTEVLWEKVRMVCVHTWARTYFFYRFLGLFFFLRCLQVVSRGTKNCPKNK